MSDMSDFLGMCNVKIRKCLWGQKRGTSWRMDPVDSNDFHFYFHGIAGGPCI